MADEGEKTVVWMREPYRIVESGGAYIAEVYLGNSAITGPVWVPATDSTGVYILSAFDAGREHARHDADVAMYQRDGQLELGDPHDGDPAPLQDFDVTSSDDLDKTKGHEWAPGELDG